MSTETIPDEIDRELGNLPATLSEEQENIVQINEIANRTVEPGLMKLPVSVVTTAENSEQIVLEVEHPIEGTLRDHLEKPVQGWSEDNELVQALRWYDIHERNPYLLQTRDVYMRYDPDGDQIGDWRLERPPSKWPTPSRRERAREWVNDRVALPDRTLGMVWGGLMVAVALAPVVAWLALGLTSIGFSAGIAVFSNLLVFIAATIVLMVALEPPGGEA